jgi:hypothetical protein
MPHDCRKLFFLLVPLNLFASHSQPVDWSSFAYRNVASSNTTCNPEGSTFRLDGQAGNAATFGSATLIEIPAGSQWSVPAGLYLATAEHVIKKPTMGGGTFTDIANANAAKENLSSLRASIPGVFSAFDISTQNYYSSPRKGEAILIPVSASQVRGIAPMKIPTTLKASGQLESYGYPGGGNAIGHATLKGGVFESLLNFGTPSGLKNERALNGEIKPGMSGGGVFDGTCSLVGVNTGVNPASTVISKLADVLKFGKLNQI